MKTHISKTHLFRDKKILRDIEIKENASLYKLAEAIVNAYDFDFDHAFGFFRKVTEGWNGLAESERYELFADLDPRQANGAKSVKKTTINEVWKKVGDKMMFLFDYGDEWRFVVELADFGGTQSKQKYPRVIKKVGPAPEQYPEVEE